MIEFKVDDGIPMPEIPEPKPMYPWAKMVKVGQSFFKPYDADNSAVHARSMQKAGQRWAKVHGNDRRFYSEVVQVNGVMGIRTWRSK